MKSPQVVSQPLPGNQHGISTAQAKELVSVIIPNFNHADYVGDAIRSVLDQVYREFEIIVVDDGSTDASREVIARFGEPVRAIWQHNQGLSAARNTGIRAARGAYIGVLDADDMYEPTFLSTLVSLLQSHPDADAVYCGYRFVDQLNRPLPQIESRDIPSGQLYQALVDGNFLVPESVLVRRRCYETVGLFDEKLRALEDLDMWLRIAGQYRVIGTTAILTRHRILFGSMSTDPTRQFQNRLAVMKKHFGVEPADESAGSAAQRRAYGQAYLASAVEYLQCHNQDRAYECLHDMARICPELLTRLSTFYELGCGDQPKGYRGDFSTVNLNFNAQTLMSMLARLFGDSECAAKLERYRRPAFANAYYALGLLSYGQRQLPVSRNYLLRAFRIQPELGLHRPFVTTLAKTLMSPALIDQYRQVTGRTPGAV